MVRVQRGGGLCGTRRYVTLLCISSTGLIACASSGCTFKQMPSAESAQGSGLTLDDRRTRHGDTSVLNIDYGGHVTNSAASFCCDGTLLLPPILCFVAAFSSDRPDSRPQADHPRRSAATRCSGCFLGILLRPYAEGTEHSVARRTAPKSCRHTGWQPASS